MFASVEGVVRGCEEEEVGSVRAVLKLDFSKVVSGNNGCDWTGQGEAMTADIEARRKQRRHGHTDTRSLLRQPLYEQAPPSFSPLTQLPPFLLDSLT